jgi:HK97 family phage portal protein
VFGQVELCLKDANEQEVEKHDVLDLLHNVNPINYNRSSFFKAIERQLCIYGTAYVLKVRGATSAQPLELYIMAASNVELVFAPNTFVAGYRWMPTGQIYPPEDVIRFWYPADDGSPYANSPTSAAVACINRYHLADTAQAAIDRRGGQGGGIVSYDATVMPGDMGRLADTWDRRRNNPENAGMDLHMPPGTNYMTGALTAQQQQREERMYRLTKEIMAAYGVPPAVAGDYADASVLANADAQMKLFWELWALSELSYIAETFTAELLPDFGLDGYTLEFDTRDIAALREDVDARANRAIMLVQGGIISINEAREMTEYDPITSDANADKVNLMVADSKPNGGSEVANGQ